MEYAICRVWNRDAEGNNRNRLRLWEKSDFVPRLDDMWQERLYCLKRVPFVRRSGVPIACRLTPGKRCRQMLREQPVVARTRMRFSGASARSLARAVSSTVLP